MPVAGNRADRSGRVRGGAAMIKGDAISVV